MKKGNLDGVCKVGTFLKKEKLVLPQNRFFFWKQKWATNWAKEEQGQKVKNRDTEYSFPKLATINPVKTGSLQ